MKRLILCLSISLISCLGLALNVNDFGAKGDGTHIDSPAINAAIAYAASAKGDGIVVVPEGVYLCYSIHLQSNVALRLEKGAVLKAAPVTQTEGYDEAEPNISSYQDFGHSHWHNSLLWGEHLQNVVIEGEGLIDGTDVLQRGGQPRGYKGMPQANKALAMRDCEHVAIRGLRFLNCGHFAMLLTGVDYLTIEDVAVDSNRDGIDIDCCEHVVVRNCRVNTPNDDAIVLKCSYALNCLKPTADVLIEDCCVSGYDAGSMLDGTYTSHVSSAPDGDGPTGRIKLGTESNGGFRDIVIRRCTFRRSRGLALETVDGAAMEGISACDLTMTDICNSPIYIRLGNRMRAPKGTAHSSVRNISIQNVTVDDADCRYACLVAGTEESIIRKVFIENVQIKYRGGITLDDVAQQRGSNPFFFDKDRPGKQKDRNGYPEPSAHGIQPAWGFSLSHASDVELRNVHLETMEKDERPWIVTDNTGDVRLSCVTAKNGDSFYHSDEAQYAQNPPDDRDAELENKKKE